MKSHHLFVVLLCIVVFSYNVIGKQQTLDQKGARSLGLSSRGERKTTLKDFISPKKKFSKASLDKFDTSTNGKSDVKPKTGYTMKGDVRHGTVPQKTDGRVPCGGYNSGLFYDRCGVCGGTNDCVDCFNVTWGKAKRDRCGICDGTNECVGCDNNTYIDNIDDKPHYDECGVCGGDGSSCLDCEGVPNGGKVLDACGNCGGDGSECCGLHGACSGHGECSISVGGCRCDVGWTGVICQAKQNLCQIGSIKTPCNSRGECNEDTGVCDCTGGWYGDQCQLNYCSGHGLYDPDLNVCICKPGYTGEDCSTCERPPEGLAYLCLQKYSLIPTGKMTQQGDMMAFAESYGNGQTIFENGAEWGDNAQLTEDNVKSLSRTTLETMVQSVIKNNNKDAISFMRIAVNENEVAVHVMGMSKLSKLIPGGKIILPGTSINDTTYGCDCRPATPVDEGQKYDVVLTPPPKDLSQDKKEKDDKKKTMQDLEKEAYDRIWGIKKDAKKDSKKEGDDSVGYNSVTIVKQRQRQEELNKPAFSEQQRVKYGAYTEDMKLISQGRFFTKFVEVRNPLDERSSKSQQKELINMYKEDILSTRSDPEVFGIALRSVSETDTGPNSAVTTVVVIASVLASVLITMGGTACIFISKRNFENNS